MFKCFKKIQLLIIFIGLNFFAFYAFSEQGYSQKTKNIIGHPPFMKSIGAIATHNDVALYDKDDLPILTAGTLLSVPSARCENSEQVENDTSSYGHFFNYGDKDGDPCLAEEAHQLSWYILDSGKTNWDTITSWHELQAKEITEINEPGSIIPPLSRDNVNLTPNLVIPDSAVDKRLGFIYTPVSSTGNPKTGAPIKVWDLNYFFGQNLINTPQPVPEDNEGFKLTPTSIFSGGGMVKEQIPPLQLRDLFISGDFMKQSKLTLNYKISHPIWVQFEDISRFWWGTKDTIKEAYFQNPNYSNSPNSFELTQEHIGQSLEVSMLPIIQNSIKHKLVGSPKVITTEDDNNQLSYPPIVSQLKITSQGYVGETLNATYTFTKVGNTQEGDASEYKWQLVNLDGSTQDIFSGVITQSGIISSGIEIQKAWQGKKIKLTLTAKDTNNRVGNILSTELAISNVNLPKITQLQFDNDAFVNFNLAASYTFDFEDKATDPDNSEYQWFFEYQDGTKTLVSSGTITSSGIIPASPIIPDNMLGRQISLTVLPKTVSGLIGKASSIEINSRAPTFYSLGYEILTNNAVAGKESNSIKLKVFEVGTNVPVSNKEVKVTSSYFNSVISLPNNFTDVNGELIANISINSGGANTINIRFDVDQSYIEVPIKFSAQTKTFKSITANNYNFAMDVGFPKTAFAWAKFQLNIDYPTSYTWQSSNSQIAQVDNTGVVTIVGKNEFEEVTISATNTSQTLTYTFKPIYWFYFGIQNNFSKAQEYCLTYQARLPTRDELSAGQFVRSVGSLWGEWGKYEGMAHTADYWTQSLRSSNNPYEVYMVNLYDGTNHNTQLTSNPNLSFYSACVIGY